MNMNVRLTDEEIQSWFDTASEREKYGQDKSIAVMDLMRALAELRLLRQGITSIRMITEIL